ncbi:Phosphate transporter PHO1-like protein 5 [Hibiscus syriacus]|uniref:Phosphate transporter PHO1-like protein 5 n=1 Tax=Hibiscus syriacus TaxID=106335 RepID=A0A6A3D7B5_HIBSY|nr:phosphate transporter PHO1 homolog 9-like [Hibiscus syriacus]KAE8735828.1 Phosphate transporter PHO1-like protein 5 [Hibiscus syriacus]
MKFGKEFAAQMVQEWQEAYMDYSKLKSILKDILKFKKQNRPPSTMATATRKGSLKRRATLYRAFSGLTSRYKSASSMNNHEDEVIIVSAVEEGGVEGDYQTMFLRSGEEGGEFEMLFFRRLDDEFNKVVKFYKKKVEETMVEADELSKQMNALIALRIKVDNPLVGGTDMVDLADNGFSSNSSSINGEKHGRTHMDAIQEIEMSSDRISKEGMKEAADREFRPAPVHVLDHVKINVELETPIEILRSVIKCSKSDLSFSRQELRTAEEKISQAFIEFYRKLRLLKSYCFLNQLAFSKIMKKYDKVSLRNASKAYMQMVDKSYLGSSDEVTKLLQGVEETYVKHFANGNHRKGLKTLRPQARKERHRITFLYGFFSGCSIALIVAIIVNIHARNILKSQGRDKYMVNVFPLYSLFGYIVLHMLMCAGNIFFWKRYRVNYSFIFGFKQGTELGYREVLLLSSGLSLLALAGVISHLDMEMDPRTKSFRTLTELIPLFLLIVVLSITFCPFNIIYRSSRFFLIRCAFHCVCAPLYKVTLPDFFLADQLTSQVQAIRSLEFYICYYGWGNFRVRSNTCEEREVYKVLYIVVAIIPYWIRFVQCLRRLFEEKDTMHGLNGLKYFSTIVAVGTRTIYQHQAEKTTTWLVLAAATSGIATLASLYWDIVIDWGLLNRNSTNPWLRDKLVVPHKGVYFVAMVLNCVLRLAWMQQVLGIQTVPFLHKTALVAAVAGLEIIRRGIWNFFRLENEHLNNVGKYRAFKSVPLPFYYDKNGDKSI